MEQVQPIRSKETIRQIIDMLDEQSPRNKLMFVLGINTGLRISDILQLTVADLVEEDGMPVQHIVVREKKTNKSRRIKTNTMLIAHIQEFFANSERPSAADRDVLVFSITRVQAYRIINKAARDVGILDAIGTHTLRKTFGYQHYQQHKDVAILQSILNHSSPSVTLRYIGVNEDMMDASIEELII